MSDTVGKMFCYEKIAWEWTRAYEVGIKICGQLAIDAAGFSDFFHTKL